MGKIKLAKTFIKSKKLKFVQIMLPRDYGPQKNFLNKILAKYVHQLQTAQAWALKIPSNKSFQKWPDQNISKSAQKLSIQKIYFF